MINIWRVTALCAILSSAMWSWSPLRAVTPKEGYKKVVLRHIETGKGKPPRITDGLDAEIVEEYAEFTALYVADDAIPELRVRAADAKLELSVRDDFDILQLPGGHIDARIGTARSLPGKSLGPAEHAGSAGSYLLQFGGPITPEWKSAVAALGVRFIQYVPHNGYIVAGRPDELNAASRLRFVQFVDVLHGVLKSQAIASTEEEAQDLLISLANVPDAEHALKTLSRLSEVDLTTEIVGEDEEELRVRGVFYGAAAAAIANERLVYAVSAFPAVELSDERVAMSLTSAVNSAGALIPPGGQYKMWLEAVCPDCTTLQQSGFSIGLADTGFWTGPQDASGQPNAGPADLPNSRVTYGTDYVVDPNGSTAHTPTAFDDTQGHGTFVGSLLAGNPAAGTDQEGFLYGAGVAPSAGLLVTKANVNVGSVTPITKLAHDARSRGVFVQNHSYNEIVPNQSSSSQTPPCNPPAPDGKYTIVSHDFDRAVRDANGVSGDGVTPITLVVPAGNRADPLVGAHRSCSPYPVRNYTNPPGTAKNVIAMGGTETQRSQGEAWSCKGAGTASLLNVEANSKRGTLDPGWFKPDLMAPAGNVTGLRIESIAQQVYCASTPSATAYAAGTGTSYAAPIGGGAALLAARAYSATPGAASPALIKAMLVMGARSMKGGKDYADWTLSNQPPNPAPTIGAIPNQSQGFGRVSVQDILEPYPARHYFNEGEALNVGGTWTNTYKVHDGTRPVTAVLTWTDVPAQISVGQMITNPLVNDLDLAVHLGATCTERYVGNLLSSNEHSNPVSCASSTFDRKNNVEYIRFSAVSSATFTVTVKFETGAGGPQNFAVAVHNAYDADDALPPSAPTGLAASGTSSTTVALTWNAVAGANGYDVRIWDGGPFWRTIATNLATTSHAAGGLAAKTTYLFDVRARNTTGVSSPSAPDAATTFSITAAFLFTDDPLIAGYTQVKATHVTELRDVISAFCVNAGLAAPTYTDPVLAALTTLVRSVHVDELRSDLNSARQALGLAPVTYTDGNLANGVVKAVHLQELRDALR